MGLTWELLGTCVGTTKKVYGIMEKLKNVMKKR